MQSNKPLAPADYIVPLHMNGLNGRMLYLPSKQSRQILMVYGSHASLERMLGFAEALQAYGTVTIPDLPGFGGMDSFYKIGQKPSIDNLADYLAAYIKLRYKNRRITIMGVSLGFVIVTRMLQKHPAIAKKVDLLVSIAGFVHHNDFALTRSTKALFRYFPVPLSWRIPGWTTQTFVLRAPLIRAVYRLAGDKNTKLNGVPSDKRAELIDFEVGLWQINDIRTYMDTVISMMKLDLCDNRVALPVYHVAITGDHFFDNHCVEQHMRVIYSDFTSMPVHFDGHAPTVIADAKEARKFIPRKLITLLKQK